MGWPEAFMYVGGFFAIAWVMVAWLKGFKDL